MSVKTVVERVQEAIDSFLPSFEKLTLADILTFAEKVKQMGQIFPGVEPDTLVTNISSLAKESAAEYFRILDEAPRRVSTEPSEIREHLKKCGEVLNKFDKLLTIVKQQEAEDSLEDETSGITIHVPTGISDIEEALGKNFHGEDFWKSQGIIVKTPDFSLYPRLTKAFLDAPYEYNPELKRSEAGILIISAANQSFNTFIRLTSEYCEAQGKNPAFFGADWRQEEDFASFTPASEEFHFITKDIVPGSTSLTFDEQIKLKKPGFFVTGAKELAEAVCMQYLENDERIYKLYGRTKDVDADGLRIVVGCSYANGARIDSNQDDSSFENVGLALSWNLKKKK